MPDIAVIHDGGERQPLGWRSDENSEALYPCQTHPQKDRRAQPQPNRQPKGGADDGRAASRLLTGWGARTQCLTRLQPDTRLLLGYTGAKHVCLASEMSPRVHTGPHRRARISFVLTFDGQIIAHASLRALPEDGPLRGRFRLHVGRCGRGRDMRGGGVSPSVCRVSGVNCPFPGARSVYPAKSRKSHRRDTTRIPTRYRRAVFPNIRAVNLRVAASRIAGGDRSPRTGRYPSSDRSRPPPPQGHIPACARSHPEAGKSLASLDDPAA